MLFDDPQAISFLLEYYRPLIVKKITFYATDWGLELNEADIEDLVQIVMIRFWKQMKVFE